MGIINVLDFRVANLIAAGEVVDRPAAVVKELLENAIDSHADTVTVEIKRGGVSFIRVSDNGCGMAREDVPIALKRHATSKIRDAEDLDSIATLGFRGEALAAIAAVSELRIMTKRREDATGTILESSGGRVTSVADAGCPDGTSVIVENLFFNTPARLKFLKKDG
ncbi:MAG: ATP-binding protein, partial [Clostridia bacterium]|nr:ATP-binding protein [Clostridia bacterium]